MAEIESKDQLIADIIHLAMRTHVETNRCIFVSFSGHINTLSVSIRKNQEEYTDIIAHKEIQLTTNALLLDENREAFERNVRQELAETKVSLETFLKDGVINETNLKKIVTYTF